MKHLFVSPERILLQRYKHDRAFRIAGSLLLAAAFLQLPLAIFGFFLWIRFQAQAAIQSQGRIRAAELQGQNAGFRDLRQRLGQVRQWEPILRNRISDGAILAVIQKAIPSNVVLDSVVIEAGNYQAVPVTGGTYRVPQEYTVLLQATPKFGSDEAIDRFKDSLLRVLPPGSELLRSLQLDKRSDGAAPAQLQFSVKPTGNYLTLGLTKISEPDTL
jgi:hypothetical protein